jgi:hypothetical protein
MGRGRRRGHSHTGNPDMRGRSQAIRSLRIQIVFIHHHSAILNGQLGQNVWSGRQAQTACSRHGTGAGTDPRVAAAWPTVLCSAPAVQNEANRGSPSLHKDILMLLALSYPTPVTSSFIQPRFTYLKRGKHLLGGGGHGCGCGVCEAAMKRGEGPRGGVVVVCACVCVWTRKLIRGR